MWKKERLSNFIIGAMGYLGRCVSPPAVVTHPVRLQGDPRFLGGDGALTIIRIFILSLLTPRGVRMASVRSNPANMPDFGAPRKKWFP
jgi:hypothetical protein